MPSITKKTYYEDRLGNVQPFIPENIQYECRMGSVAYGANKQGQSDTDLYGITIPPKHFIFPHTKGYIVDFDDRPKFDQFQKHHVHRDDDHEYDFAVYNIVRFFKLAIDNNPNIIDALFVPQTCITHYTSIGEIIRENRHEFLSSEYKHRSMGYAFSQIKKLENPGQGDRSDLVEKYGWDVKFGYHCVRLVTQCEQVLAEGDLDLRKTSSMLQSIRNGEWTKEELQDWFDKKEDHIDELYRETDLPDKPDKDKIKAILVECLEEFYGEVEEFVTTSQYEQAVEDIKQIVRKF